MPDSKIMWDLLPLVAMSEDYQWTEDDDGFIRDQLGRCPLCALADELSGVVSGEPSIPYRAAFLGFGDGELHDFENIGFDIFHPIAYAADRRLHRDRPRLQYTLGMS